MREGYRKQLEALHTDLIHMGALCEQAIACATHGLLEENTETLQKAIELEREIDEKQREIEMFCIRLLLREQPVAGDLRRITTAQKMITDMERIGDQAADIAEISAFLAGKRLTSEIHISDMAKAAIQMLSDSVDSFVSSDVEKARATIRYDDVVDGLFAKIKGELGALMARDSANAGACLDLLMIAKYLERIGDHAENIAEWVVYSITGDLAP